MWMDVEQVLALPPLEGLVGVACLAREVADAEEVLVRRARVQGATWDEIATALGVTRQTVHRKYASRGLMGVRP